MKVGPLSRAFAGLRGAVNCTLSLNNTGPGALWGISVNILGITYSSRSCTNVTYLAAGETANCTVRQKLSQIDLDKWAEDGQWFVVKLRVDATASNIPDGPIVHHYVNTTVPLQALPGVAIVSTTAWPSTVVNEGA